MTGRKVFNKHSPSEGDKFFIPLPSDARHYIHHSRMNADKLYLYALIIDYYNPLEGRAFPTLETLSIKYGKVTDTTSHHLKDLQEVGLIDFPEMGYYIPLEPLDEQAFFSVFPEAKKNMDEAIEKSDTRRAKAAERMRKFREEKGYML